MTKWYDRIGNTIQMNVDGEWVKGKIVEGYRTHDGFVNMQTDTGRKIGCGASMEGVSFKKCDDSLGDLRTNADRIRSMTDEELAEIIVGLSEHCLAGIGACDCSGVKTQPCYEVCGEITRKWLQQEVEE